MSLYEIPVHESAHGLVAWQTGCPIPALTMVTDAEYRRCPERPRRFVPLGRAYFPGPPASATNDRRNRLLADREAMISLAGDLAVRMYRGTPLKKQPTDSDLDSVAHAAALAKAAGEDVETHLGLLVSKTLLVLNVNWGRLLALADALLDKRKLSSAEIKDLLRGR